MYTRGNIQSIALAIAVSAGNIVASGNAEAQDSAFADDFSFDSTRYATGSFNNASGIFAIDKVDNTVRLSATGTQAAPGSAYLEVHDASDTFSADVQLDPESDNGSAVFVEAQFYSDTPNPAPGTNEGDILVQLTASVYDDRTTDANYCFLRRTANGDNVNLGDFGSEFCTDLPGATIVIGQTHTLGLAIDRAASTITISVDDASKVVSLPGVALAARSSLRRIQSWLCCDREGTSDVRVFGVSTQNFTDDFTVVDPVINRYQGLRSNDAARSATHNDGRLRLSATSFDRGTGIGISPAKRTDYYEALVTLSSESIADQEQQRADARMNVIFYNDTKDGSGLDDDRTGDVRAEILLIAEANGRRQAEYCLTRSNDPNFDDRTRLLANGKSCLSFPMVVEFDKPYRLSIELDRNKPEMIFRLDGFTKTIAIDTPVFQPVRGRQKVSADADRLGSAVVYVDDLRTAPHALTASEIAAGAITPAQFPTAPDLSALQADSSLPTPFDFSYVNSSLDFVDDFSGPSYQFGFWGGGANGGMRGQSGVQYTDGAIEMQTNSAADNNDGNWTEFYINDISDTLKARVSLASSSRLPPDPDAEAKISIRATFVNDTQDGGFDGRDGDIESGITLSLRGDGRREINIDLRRRNADGSSESLTPFNKVEFAPVDELTPELDTVYEFGVAVDRERQVLIFSVNDTSVEYQLTSQAFRPSLNRLIVSTNHTGSSGNAIGYLHSIKTDNIDQDFNVTPPALAPYWPSFHGQQLGHTTSVIDGRLRLEADSTQASSRGPFLTAHGLSDHISAIVELSSESNVLSGGEGFVRLSGQFYNDLDNGGNGENAIGDVFSEIKIEDRGDGERFVSYCAGRVNNADFSESTELIGGDIENCPRMATVPALDTPYTASITFDRANATLTYRFADESVQYNITTGVFTPARTFSGVAVRASDGSKIIAFADDLAFDSNPVPLISSSNLLISEFDSTGESNSSGGSDTTIENSSGGSGCSIKGSTGKELPVLAILAAYLLFARRRRNTSKNSMF